jgi:multidrug efflux pump subunit AcrA (membrane-fusion protein)
MRKLILTVSVAGLLAGFGYGFAAAIAADEAAPVNLAAVPVFPAETKQAPEPVAVPVHATHKIQNGKSVRFLACRESRDVRGNAELRCLSWNKAKGWSKSPKWIPAYQLLSLR